MTKVRLRDLEKLAREFCGEVYVEAINNGHYRIALTGPKGTRTVFAPSTPSDWRSMKNMRSQIRRTAKELGCNV